MPRLHLRPVLPIFLTLLFAIAGIAAYGQEKKDKVYIKTTKMGTSYEVIGWETDVVYNPFTFTWHAYKEPVIAKKETDITKMIPVSEFDRPPVFDRTCLMAEDQLACSNEKLHEYMEEHSVEYPEAAKFLGQEGLEYVTFTLDENGLFDGNLKIVSKDDPCNGCEDAAADLVAGMESKWFPAILEGKTVKTQLTIPVRFKLIE